MSVFVFEGIYNDDCECLDLHFSDTCPNAARRLWDLSFDKSSLTWSGLLRRSKTDDGAFEHGTQLPKKMVAAILADHIAKEKKS